MKQTSVGIIGAGIGGLVAGAYLSQAGYPVTIIEKAVTVGGSAGTYTRQGQAFPTGATIAFGLETGGLLRMILDDLQITLPASKLIHPMDVILPDRTVAIYQEQGAWETELEKSFPEKQAAVLAFWQHLSHIARHVLAVSQTRIALPIRHWHDVGDFPKYALTHPRSLMTLATYSIRTVYDLLQTYKLTNYEPLIQFLNAQLVDSTQTDVTEAALLPSAVALDIYRNGSFYIEGGMVGLANALAERITACGGQILLATSVKECRFDTTSTEWQINTNRGNEFSFALLINGTGIALEERDTTAPLKDEAWGAVRLDILLRSDGRKRDLPFAYQVVPSPTHATLWQDPHGPVYLTLHPHTSDQDTVLTVSVHSPAKDWLEIDKATYQAKKAAVTEAILATCEQVVPDLRERLLVCHTGTPHTYRRYVGKVAVGGKPLTVKQAILRPQGARSRHKQLFYVGENYFPGPGTLSAALSGFYAARTIMHR